jgi:hypothetical protein
MRKLIVILMLTLFVSFILTPEWVLARQQRGEKYSVAVLNFAATGGNITASDTRVLTGNFTEEIAGANLFFTMSQDNMERGLAAKNVDSEECGANACAIQAGRALGVQVVIFGTIAENAGVYSTKIQMLHIGSKQVVKSMQDEYVGDLSGLLGKMPSYAKRLVGRNAAQPSSRQLPPEPTSYTPSYATENGGGFKWQYVGIGLLVAGGIGAGVFLAQKGGSNGNPPLTELPGAPDFP